MNRDRAHSFGTQSSDFTGLTVQLLQGIALHLQFHLRVPLENLRFSLKARLSMVAAALVLSMPASGKCYAQERVKANIPFEFVVGEATLPAGEYQIKRALVSDSSAQVIQRSDGSVSMIVLTNAADQKGNDGSPRLIFQRYGSQYFLSQIWWGQTGRQLHKSRREKELARTEQSSEVALLLLPVTSGQR